MQTNNLVEVKNLTKKFKVGRNAYLHAVDKVSLNIKEGEILGLVGESGCGKSTLGRLLIRLHKESEGTILFEGKDITQRMNSDESRDFRTNVQLIFQDPYSSLNPRMTIKEIICEGPDATGLWTPEERDEKVAFWLERVGLHRSHANRYPHEFSGGQRQRIGIARALAVDPKLVICDEPISALDVSVQAQVINLLKELQVEKNLTYLFIAHDLSMVRAICDRMIVMYLGQIVEFGTASKVYDDSQHPYTQALVAANPIPDPIVERSRQHKLIEGEISSPVNPTPGCRFAPRCPYVMDICKIKTPELLPVVEGKQLAACHLYN